MKIERLYTSKGFGKYLDSLSIREFCVLEDINNNIKQIEYDAIRYRKRRDYDLFIDGSVTKEMVANLESQDWVNEDGSINVKIQLRWMEAEKKVIFTAEAIKDCNNLGIHTKDFYFGRYIISFYDDGEINLSIDESEDIAVKTLEDLAYYTNGELETKNFEI